MLYDQTVSVKYIEGENFKALLWIFFLLIFDNFEFCEK